MVLSKALAEIVNYYPEGGRGPLLGRRRRAEDSHDRPRVAKNDQHAGEQPKDVPHEAVDQEGVAGPPAAAAP